MEHREVQGEAQLDRVAWGKVNVVSFLVVLKSLLLVGLELVPFGVFSNVAIIVTDHLNEEGLCFCLALLRGDLFSDDLDDPLAVSSQLLLDLVLVALEGGLVLVVLGVLLNGGDGAAGGALARDQVLESNREKVTLISAHVAVLLIEHQAHEGDHVVEALSLLGDTGEENVDVGV